MLYKIVIDDRSYSKWQIYDAPTFTPVTLDLDPCLKRLFSGDVFTYVSDNKNDAVNDNVDLDNDNDGIPNCAESYGNQVFNFFNT